jgi:hypothetical protein
MATSLSPVGVVWAIFSFLAAAVACFGLFMPYWLLGVPLPNWKGSDGIFGQQISFGTFRRCGYVVQMPSVTMMSEHRLTNYVSGGSDPTLVSTECGRYETFADIPSIWWKVAGVVTGTGCCIAVTVAFAGLLCCCVSDAMSHKTSVFACVMQLCAGCCVMAGCLLYPVGWDSDEVKQACGQSAHRYSWGSCRIGWAYYSTMASGAALFLCSWLACYSAKRKGGYQRTPVVRI